MVRKPRLRVTSESDTGRNQNFIDTRTGEEMTRAQVVRKIESGDYDDYHVRVVNGVKTPASNPNKEEGDNLG